MKLKKDDVKKKESKLGKKVDKFMSKKLKMKMPKTKKEVLVVRTREGVPYRSVFFEEEKIMDNNFLYGK